MSGFNGTVQDWQRSGTTVYALNIEGSNRFRANVEGGWAIDGRRRTDEDELLANARLVAAAPELLKELTHLYRCLRPWIDAGKSVPGIATLNAAEAAIAKATGGDA